MTCPADVAVRPGGEADDAVDAPICTPLLAPGLASGADEVEGLPLELPRRPMNLSERPNRQMG